MIAQPPGGGAIRGATDAAAGNLARHLIDYSPDAHTVNTFTEDADETEVWPDLESALVCGDADDLVAGLYVAILGRPPDAGSRAADDVKRGVSPLDLAQFLLQSDEGRQLPRARQRLLMHEIEKRRTRVDLGLPLTGPLLPYACDPDVPFILTCYRVGLGRRPSHDEFTNARQMLSAGMGRERLLRVVWRDASTEVRIFGASHRNLRGLVASVVHLRLFSTYRAHVLAAEGSMTAILLALQPTHDPSAESLLRSDTPEGQSTDWEVLARLDFLSSGVRRLAGDHGW